ncbi:MAG: hypothetical protein CR997_05265 [Acidobacteria bacterium]|nr:MAG: hypothetical protein CR997_05265 [Acidobacteriota bacterium]
MKASKGGNFEPEYFAFLDDIYHCHWSLQKSRKIHRLKKAVKYFWPNGHPTRLLCITGTNGKGSVAYYLEQGLMQWGSTGSWTGPHVFDYAERFHICGQIADHGEIVQIYREEIEPYQLTQMQENESLGFASIGVLIALKLFERHSVQWGIMEVGAGGRHTPLMALDAVGTILTNIGMDHPLTLGSELWQRAVEKAGMAKPGIPFFSAETGEARAFVEKTVLERGATYFGLTENDCDHIRQSLKEDTPLFRIKNLALAVKVILHYYPNTDGRSLLDSMKSHLPGRFSRLQNSQILIDVAHNQNKIDALAEHLKLTYPGKKFIFLIGLTRKRNPEHVFASLFSLGKRFFLTSASYAGQPPGEIAEKLKGKVPGLEVIEDPREAIQKARESLSKEDILVLTGSAYMLDQALNPSRYLAHLNASYGWRGKNSN